MSGQLPSDQLRLPILADAPWRVAVVSPTGRYARNQVAGMIEAGTPLVGGVALGRGGTDMDGLPLYDRIAEIPQKPNIALIYTPAEGVRDAVAECAQARIETIMAVAEYVPVHDALAAAHVARAAGSWLIGPNTLGIYVPGRGLLGSIAPSFCMPGRLALIIRSGTLALAMARQLTLAGIGQRIVAHVGGECGNVDHRQAAAGGGGKGHISHLRILPQLLGTISTMQIQEKPAFDTPFEWIGGESLIAETVGLGGFAQAAAFRRTPCRTY